MECMLSLRGRLMMLCPGQGVEYAFVPVGLILEFGDHNAQGFGQVAKTVCAVHVKFGVFVPGGDGFGKDHAFSDGRKPTVDKHGPYGANGHNHGQAAEQCFPHLRRRKTVGHNQLEAHKHGGTGQHKAYNEKNDHAKAEGNIHTSILEYPLPESQVAEEKFCVAVPVKRCCVVVAACRCSPTV